MAKTKNNVQQENKVKYDDPRMAYLSTKPELVVKETTIKLNQLYSNAFSDVAVICEDQKGLYVTGKSYVGSLMLDPYRQYNRNSITVTKTETGFDIETNNNVYSV